MDQTKWEEFRKKLEDFMADQGQKGEIITKLSNKVKELETQFLQLLPTAKGTEVPIIPGVSWPSEKSAHDFALMMKHVFLKDSDTLKQMTEGVDADGGHLVPTEFRATLVRLIETFGMIRRRATIIPMNREELYLPKLTSGVTVYWPGEASAITPSKPGFDRVTLTAKKMAALVPVSGELLEDSAIAIGNLLATLFAEAMAAEEDRVGLVGSTSGGDPFDGIMEDSTVQEVTMAGTTFASMTADDLLDLTGAVASSAMAGSGFVMHRTVFDTIRKLKDTNGGYIYAQPSAGQPGTIWGFPYELNDTMPALTDTAVDTSFVIFGNFRHLYFGDRRTMSVAQSIHAGFTEDITYIRAIQRLAMAVAIGTAFAKLTTAAA